MQLANGKWIEACVFLRPEIVWFMYRRGDIASVILDAIERQYEYPFHLQKERKDLANFAIIYQSSNNYAYNNLSECNHMEGIGAFV